MALETQEIFISGRNESRWYPIRHLKNAAAHMIVFTLSCLEILFPLHVYQGKFMFDRV